MQRSPTVLPKRASPLRRPGDSTDTATLVTTDLTRLSATELLDGYRSTSFSPVEVIEAVLAEVDRREGDLNAFCHLDPEAALRDARASETRWQKGEPCGLLDGVPATAKDIAPAKGWPTRRGSWTSGEGEIATFDSAPVARLREQGAVLFGKTNLPEMAWKGVTDSPRFGITRNPWNLERTPGGSSGGASAAVSAYLGPMSIGTDGSGSVRIPAAFCSIFGMKPTYGVIPQFPLASYMSDIVHTGPLTRTVRDGALMLTVMAGRDRRDWTAPPLDPDHMAGLDDGIAGLRIAYSADFGHVPVDPEVARVAEAAVSAFAELGAHVERADPGFEDPRDVIDMIYQAGAATVLAGIPEADQARLDPGYLAFAKKGFVPSARDYVAIAMNRRNQLAAQMVAFHERYDLLVSPQVGLTAIEAGRDFPPDRGHTHWFDWAGFSYPFNLTQQPAATVPCGLAADGMPVALQIVGPKFADRMVLRAARAFEMARPFPALA